MSLKNRRIFIVEDNVGNLAVASIYLEQDGAKIKVERRGLKTAQAVLRSLPIDIILTDLMLPNSVSGFDIFDEIRRVPELAAIPVVAVSAADPDVAMVRTLQSSTLSSVASRNCWPRSSSYSALPPW